MRTMVAAGRDVFLTMLESPGDGEILQSGHGPTPAGFAALVFFADLRRREREAEPDLTIPQLRDGLDADVKGWSVPFEARLRLLCEAVRRINYYQSKNAAARRSHTRTTIARYHAAGIDVAAICRCEWPKSS